MCAGETGVHQISYPSSVTVTLFNSDIIFNVMKKATLQKKQTNTCTSVASAETILTIQRLFHKVIIVKPYPPLPVVGSVLRWQEFLG